MSDVADSTNVDGGLSCDNFGGQWCEGAGVEVFRVGLGRERGSCNLRRLRKRGFLHSRLDRSLGKIFDAIVDIVDGGLVA